MAKIEQRDGNITGPVESAIRAHVRAGLRLPTPTARATFIVSELNPRGIVLLLGPKHTHGRP
jgi:hypothetical protein